MTRVVNEGEDAGRGASQGIFWASLVVWMLWPAGFVLIFRNGSHDFVGEALRDYFFYPPSLINITSYWGHEPVFQSLYVSTWYVNSVMLAFCYFFYLLGDLSNERRRIQGARQRIKSIGLALFGFVASFVTYSSGAFDTQFSITYQERFLLENAFGQFFVLPLVYVGAACAPLGAIDLFIAACRGSVFNANKGERK